MSRDFATPPSLADLEAIALEERDLLPEPFRSMVAHVPVLIEDFCEDEELLAELGIESPWDLSGLYEGTAEPHKSTGHVAQDTDRIFLFRRPLLDELGIESPWDLSGLYEGTAEPHKSTGHVAQDTDRIFLFRRPLLDEWCEAGIDLRRLVRHVLVHEIGHHFGFSDADMDEIERGG